MMRPFVLLLIAAVSICLAGFTSCKGSSPCSRICDAACSFIPNDLGSEACKTACTARAVSESCNSWVESKLDWTKDHVLDLVGQFLVTGKKLAAKRAAALPPPAVKVLDGGAALPASK